jgi:hypothetical protein
MELERPPAPPLELYEEKEEEDDMGKSEEGADVDEEDEDVRTDEGENDTIG